jgi:uncharacterized membrane protein
MFKLSAADKIVMSFLLFIAAMLVLRIAYANNVRYVFLLWNLFLAWIPFQLGVVLTQNQHYNKWIKYGLLACWLLFFPNALYIITDLIHLENSGDKVPVWFDAILLFTSSVTGLIMAFVSLFQVELFLYKYWRTKHVNKLIVAVLFLGSFGVYLGRFLRWNSWDIVANPVSLLIEVTVRFTNPFLYYKTWVVTVLLTCLFSLLYFASKKMTGLFARDEHTMV